MSFPSPTDSSAWIAAGWTMIHLTWVGLVAGLIAATGRRLLKQATPEARYGFALACLLALGASPAILFALNHEMDAKISGLTPIRTPTSINATLPDVAPTTRPGATSRPRPSAGPPARPTTRLRLRLDAWVGRLPWLWLAGSLLSTAALGTGMVGVERLRRGSRPVEAGAVARSCRALADSLGVARRVGLAACDRLAAPVLIGVFRPMILLPSAAFDAWGFEQVEMALLHELAHLRRWDNLVNLLQRGVESLLFFHPVAWWLSAWVRLERELCCDRLVVERTGRPCAYAEMLAGLAMAGSGRGMGGRRAVLGMADRQVTTRIRRILNKEDRSMTMTLPEGFGLIGAAIVGAALALGAHAAAPPTTTPAPDKPEDSVRRALREAVEAVGAVAHDGREQDAKGSALTTIAGAQLDIGDRDAALATLRKAAEPADKLDFRGNFGDRIANLIAVAGLLRKAGDPAAGRALLDRLTRSVEAMEVDPARQPKVVEAGQGMMMVQEQSPAMIQAELLAMLCDERTAAGDLEPARATIRRAIAAIGAQEGPLRSIFLAGFGPMLARAGDPAGAREAIEQARRSALGLAKAEERAKALSHVAQAFGEMGDVGGALRLVATFEDEASRQAALRSLVDSLAEEDTGHRWIWLDPGGIKILIGAVGSRPKDPAVARRELPKVARALEATADRLRGGRTLARVAHLQAMAGDLAGARATAEAIPDLKRADFPGPADGSYDAVRPGTLAIVARLMAGSGDRAGADDLFRRATGQTRAIEADDQAIVARLVVARERSACGEHDHARVLLGEALPVALKQPEPLRSRSLAMIVEGLAKAGDLGRATATAGLIRDYPVLEKSRALYTLADSREESGDHEAARQALRDALRIVEAKAPERPAMGQVGPRLLAWSQATFFDPNFEFAPEIVRFHAESSPINLRARLGDLEGALGLARALPAGGRDSALSGLAGALAGRGDVWGALGVAATIESPEQRLTAVELTAHAIKERAARR